MFTTVTSWFAENFFTPWVLWLLPLALIPAWRSGRPAIRYSSNEPIRVSGRSWRAAALGVLPYLRCLVLALAIVCLARPRLGNQQTRVTSEGVAIQLVVDRSSSMEALDFKLDGQPVNRLTAVKHVVKNFVSGVGGLPGRPDDLIGLIAFAGYADSVAPATLGHEFLLRMLERTQTAEIEDEDGTAIGNALALGVERIAAVESHRRLDDAHKIKSKIVILLTDGDRTAGDIDPDTAAELAQSLGIKVYTIGVGTDGLALIPIKDVFGRRVMRQARVTINEELLQKVATTTGGKYFRAKDTESLAQIYAEIDALEKTEISEQKFMEYKDLATEWTRWSDRDLPPLLYCLLALLALDVLLSNTLLRTSP